MGEVVSGCSWSQPAHHQAESSAAHETRPDRNLIFSFHICFLLFTAKPSNQTSFRSYWMHCFAFVLHSEVLVEILKRYFSWESWWNVWDGKNKCSYVTVKYLWKLVLVKNGLFFISGSVVEVLHSFVNLRNNDTENRATFMNCKVTLFNLWLITV